MKYYRTLTITDFGQYRGFDFTQYLTSLDTLDNTFYVFSRFI